MRFLDDSTVIHEVDFYSRLTDRIKLYLRESGHGAASSLVKLLHLIVRHLLLVHVAHFVGLFIVGILEDALHIQFNIALLTAHLGILAKK